MPQKKKALAHENPALSPREQAVRAALELSGTLGWDMITLGDVAQESGLSLGTLSELFDDKTDLLVAYGRMLDRDVLEACGKADPALPARERLFDVLMERFERLNEDRPALLSVLSSFRGDPKQAVISLPHLGRSMAWMLEAAGIDTQGLRGAARVAGLCGTYLYVLRVWKEDDSPDLSKTMSALDKALSRAEQAANSFMLG